MKYILIILSGVGAAFCSPRQQNCNIIPSNNKIIDTVIVRVTYVDFMMFVPNDPAILYLEKKGHLKAKDVKSAIRFIPENCDKVYTCPLSDASKVAREISIKESGQKVIATCVIFRDKYLTKGLKQPVIIVTKLRKAE
ncbi:hypothetical protein ACFQ3S_05780 [Mucilaginibacter terrae]|uniref:hypothetical protein n=1 Tax=Mucilaginibacter terrae TaxID=1955052 RepID=UPI00362D3525